MNFLRVAVKANLTDESSSESNFSEDDNDSYLLSDDDSEVRVKS